MSAEAQQQVAFHRAIPPGVSLTLSRGPTMPSSSIARSTNPQAPNPRSTIINKASGSVTGAFHLYDSLCITTIAGSINITIILQPAAPASHRTPPELKLSSSTGNITVHTILRPSSQLVPNPLDQVPDRQYITTIETRSGNIIATLPHSKKTSMHTVSGNISVRLHPVGPTSTPSTIDVRNASGSTQLTLYPHLKQPSAPLRMIGGDYHGTTGSLNIVYPLTWEGEIVSKMSKGMVKHQWPGLRVFRAGPRFTAKKGDAVGMFGEIGIHGKGMEVNLMGIDMPLPWFEDESRRSSLEAGGRTRPPSYVGHPPSYQECVGLQDGENAAEPVEGRMDAAELERRMEELGDMLRVRHATAD